MTHRTLGATLVVALVSVGAATTAAATGRTASSCGSERWTVRNLFDPTALQVDLHAAPADIHYLRSVPRPARVGPATPRLRPLEFRSFAIKAPLLAARRLPSHDTVAVVGKPPDTMLVVFPDTHLCEDVGLGPHGGDIHSAGDGFNADCGPSIPSDHWQRLTGDAEIAGVAYFAVRHSSSTPGAAPTGLELHPVMSFWAPGCRQLNARWP